MEKNRDPKRKNIVYFKRVRFLKKLFYILIVGLEKLGITIALAPFINKLLKKLGIRKNVLGYSNYKRLGVAFNDAFSNDSSKNEQVLFPMMFGISSNFNLLNLLLAKYLEGKGYHPIFLVCNKSYTICQKERIGKSRKNTPLFCYECYGGYPNLKVRTGIDLKFMEDISIENKFKNIIDEEILEINKIADLEGCLSFKLKNGYNIGQATKKRILRYYFISTLTGSKKEVETYIQYLKNGVKYYYLMLSFLNRNPRIRKIILHNGTLAYEHYLFDIASRKNIAVITYETYLGNNSFIYKLNDEVMKLKWEKEMRNYYNKTVFTDENKKQVDEFFEGMERGKDMYARLNLEHSNEKLTKVDKYVCLFTNLNFDTAVLDRHTIFNSMEHWIYEVIDFWEKNVNDIHLIIRVHPAEIKLQTPGKDFVGDKIKQRIQSSKIILIDSDEKVNSYNLIENMLFGLVYASTIGIEAAYRKKVVIVSGDPFYVNQPFVLVPQSKEEYFDDILSLLSGESAFIPDLESLYRFVYYKYFIRIKKLQGFYIQFRGEITTNEIENYQSLLEKNRYILDEFYNECFN